ncbi:ferritin-like domain-containing protein [Rubrivirga sp.]|uniref:ferritin-like domain-containing protein n=1 Tax=Rubrivirga sp. TaxID=1885344 RepID=UPI003C7742CB
MSTPLSEGSPVRSGRRAFFKRASLGLGAVAAATALQSCDSDDPVDVGADVTLDFSNDFGVLNYAYALEQLEAAFYDAVISDGGFGGAFSTGERAILDDLAAHEAIHRDFLRAAIVMAGGESAVIGGLTPDFGTVDFGSRTSVLQTSLALEDTGVGAYNGAGRYIADEGYLLLAGKIVSVEARHASVIAGLLQDNAIAGDGTITTDTALDLALTPDQVVGPNGRATPFITDMITVVNVPSS